MGKTSDNGGQKEHKHSKENEKRISALEKGFEGLLQSNKDLHTAMLDIKAILAPPNPMAASSPSQHSTVVPESEEGELSEDNTEAQSSQGACTMAERFGMQPFGSDIEPGLSENITFALENSLDPKKLADVFEKYKPPKNCPALQVPALNEELAEKISAQRKRFDYKMSTKVQKPLMCGITALAKALASDEDPSDFYEDALLLLSQASNGLSEVRKEGVKSGLPIDFKALGKKSSNELLFGDDIVKQLRELKEVKRATTPMQNTFFKAPSRFQPYARKQNSRPYYQQSYQQPKRPFLGRGRGQPHQGRKTSGKQ